MFRDFCPDFGAGEFSMNLNVARAARWLNSSHPLDAESRSANGGSETEALRLIRQATTS